MFAQYYPGAARSNENRLVWFKQCLDAIEKLGINSIAFPYGIGCGLAKGKWSDYYDMIKNFAANNPNINVTIVKLE